MPDEVNCVMRVFPMCACVMCCVCVCICLCAHWNGGQWLVIRVFVDYSPSYVLKWGFSLDASSYLVYSG